MGATPFATNHHLPFHSSGLSSHSGQGAISALALASAAETLSNQSALLWSVLTSLKADEMHRAFSSSSNYGEQRPGTSLGYDVYP